MVKITVELDSDEYLEAKRRGLSHKEIYLKGLGMDYTPKPIGRPKAFDIEEIERRAREEYLAKVKAYNEAHSADFEAARKKLGIGLKIGEMVVPPLARRDKE